MQRQVTIWNHVEKKKSQPAASLVTAVEIPEASPSPSSSHLLSNHML